jgi:nucleosome binding factor SPN SPT16 subunit
MTQLLDDERKISHEKLAEKIDGILDNDDFFKKAKISNDFNVNGLDWAVRPVIQSGGNYDLKFAGKSDDRNLHAGIIVAGLGFRYNTYASFVARTYLVDPSKTQEANYTFLRTLHESILKNVRDGAAAKDVYNKALALVKSKKPELEQNFVKSVGYGIGIETKDATLSLAAKSTRTLKDGMTLVISTGFTDVTNPEAGDTRSRTYAMVLADTIRVTTGEAAVFSKAAHSDIEAVSFFFKDEDEPTPKKSSKRDPRIGAVAQQNITSTRLRKERQANHDAEKESARREHQKELQNRKLQQGLEKYSRSGAGVNGAEEKKIKRFESYKRDNQLPSKVKDMGIVLDTKNSTIVLPIIGRPVPFHVNTIKNASTTAEGEFTSLRINFLSPGQGVGRRDDQPFEDPTAQFVRSLTYRSEDTSRMEAIAKQITDLKKESVRKDQEKKQLEDVVEQDKLLIGKSFYLCVGNRLLFRSPPSETRYDLPPPGSGQQAGSWARGDTPKWYSILAWHGQ